VRPHLCAASLNCYAVKLVKKLLGENEAEAVLQRLDRLTLEEARTTAAQTLDVVYSLIQNMRVVMDGKQILLAYLPPIVQHFLCRRSSITRQRSGCPRYIVLIPTGDMVSD
jgi:hypothetical protein